MDPIQTLKEWIDESKRIVFFGGAGVSTESGIKDFRSVDGLYSQKFPFPPEVIISHRFYKHRPEDFFQFYRDHMMSLGFLPNVTHKKLAQLEEEGKLLAVVTQNIDGLHQLAGSKRVLELHGSIYRNYCTACGKFHTAEFMKNCRHIPRCSCGGIVKPDVVLYDEVLNVNTVNESIRAIEEADMLIVAGTSLTVYPAAGYISCFSGRHLVLINNDETMYDNIADLVIRKPLGTVFSEL